MVDIGQSRHIASLHYQIKNCDDILSVSEEGGKGEERRRGSEMGREERRKEMDGREGRRRNEGW